MNKISTGALWQLDCMRHMQHCPALHGNHCAHPGSSFVGFAPAARVSPSVKHCPSSPFEQKAGAVCTAINQISADSWVPAVQPCGGAIPLCMIDEFDLPADIIDRKVTKMKMISPSNR